MILRPATLDDLPTLQRWDRAPHVVQASGEDGPFDWAGEIPREVDWREILIAESGGRAIGVIVIIDPAREETHYWGEVSANLRAIDIWIGAQNDLGRGYGTRMMRLALDRCFEPEDVTAVLVDPLAGNRRAHRFYERLGFKRVERRVFGVDECYVYRLERRDWRRVSMSAMT